MKLTLSYKKIFKYAKYATIYLKYINLNCYEKISVTLGYVFNDYLKTCKLLKAPSPS